VSVAICIVDCNVCVYVCIVLCVSTVKKQNKNKQQNTHKEQHTTLLLWVIGFNNMNKKKMMYTTTKQNGFHDTMLGGVFVFMFLAVTCCKSAQKGFDHSYYQGLVNSSCYECLVSNGYSYAILQAQTGHPLGDGHYNPYIGPNYHSAISAGISPIDVYIFPDYGQDPVAQVNQTISLLFQDDVLYHNNMIYMDVENTQYWPGTCDENIEFLHKIIATAESMYYDCGLNFCIGIYSSASQWSPIMCGTTEFSKYPLWYPHYDNDPSFQDWKPFGGWVTPVMKQYTGTTSICGTEIDNDYKP